MIIDILIILAIIVVSLVLPQFICVNFLKRYEFNVWYVIATALVLATICFIIFKKPIFYVAPGVLSLVLGIVGLVLAAMYWEAEDNKKKISADEE